MRVDRRNISGAGSVLPADAAPHAESGAPRCRLWHDGRFRAAALAPTWVCRGAAAERFQSHPAVTTNPRGRSNPHQDLHAEHDELVQIARAEMDSLYEQISDPLCAAPG